MFGETNEFHPSQSDAGVLEAQAEAFSEITRSLTQAVEQAREQAADIVRRAQEHATSVVNSANEHAADAYRQAVAAEQRTAAAHQRVEAAEARLAGMQGRIDQTQAKLSAIGQQASEIARMVAAEVELEPAVEAVEVSVPVVAETEASAEQLVLSGWSPDHVGSPWNSEEHWGESRTMPNDGDMDPFGVLASLRHAVDNASG